MLILVVATFQNCAIDLPPTGGPEDKTPPKIINTFPDSGATRVRTDRIRLTFDKYIATQSLRSAVFFSPRLTDYEIEWNGGKEAEIIIYEPLKLNRTYSYTITKALTDTRGNPLAASYSFAFSTGEQIDSGAMGGKVFNQDNRWAQGATVFAYLIPAADSIFLDTLNPATTAPDYIAQTNEKGEFELRFLKIGAYRLFALVDKNENLRYDSGESFGTPFDSAHTGKMNLRLRLTDLDTTRIDLQTANAYTTNRFALRFDRNLTIDSLSISNFALFDSTSKKSVQLYDLYANSEGGRELIYLVCDSLVKEHLYGIRATAVQDKFGNRADTLISSFVGIDEPDTLRAQLFLSFADSAKNLLEFAEPSTLGRTISIEFTLPIFRQSLDSALTLKKKNDTLNLRFFFRDGRKVRFKPVGEFELGEWYQLIFNHGKLLDARLRQTMDSLITVNFQIVGKESLGELEGEIELDSTYQTAEKLIMTAELVSEKKFYSIIVEKQKSGFKFKFEELPEGKYFLSAFLPKDSINITPFRAWNGGRLKPFQFAEPFWISLDSLRARRRWTTDGIEFRAE